MPGRRRPEISEPVGTLVQLSTRVPRSLWQRVRLFSVEQDRHMQDFIAKGR